MLTQTARLYATFSSSASADETHILINNQSSKSNLPRCFSPVTAATAHVVIPGTSKHRNGPHVLNYSTQVLNALIWQFWHFNEFNYFHTYV